MMNEVLMQAILDWAAGKTTVSVELSSGWCVFHRRQFNAITGEPAAQFQAGEIEAAELADALADLDAKRAALATLMTWAAGPHAEPTPPTAPAPARLVSVEAFRRRFSDAEALAIWGSTDSAVRLLVVKLTTRQTAIDLDDPQIVGGLAYLVSVGLLTSDRPAIIRG